MRQAEEIKKKKRRIWWRKTKEKRYQVRRDWVKRNKEKHRQASRKYRRQRRWEMIREYGGKCQCCGESRYEFLSIDHINGKGREHWRQMGKEASGNYLIHWLKVRNWPKDNFQLLCMNCNWAKEKYGACPHKDLEEV